jgi:GT2 family glycosyltransferase
MSGARMAVIVQDNPMMCDVSIVIVNWNACNYLRDCVGSIIEQTKASFEVIVVDNASSDGSQAMLETEFPGVRTILNSANRGFAAGNNQGIKVARGRYVLLLNPDTLILDGAIDTCVAYADTLKDVGVLGCQVLEDETTIQKTCFKFPSPLNILLNALGLTAKFPKSRFFGRAKMGWWDRRDEREVDVVSGMFMLVRRQALERVGPMDERYFMFAEEADWCYRFWRMGWRCLFTPRARIMHLEGGGRSTQRSPAVSTKMYVQLQKSLLLFHRKNRGLLSWTCAKLVYLAAMAYRLIVCALMTLLGKGEAWRGKANQALAALRYHVFRIEPQP